MGDQDRNRFRNLATSLGTAAIGTTLARMVQTPANTKRARVDKKAVLTVTNAPTRSLASKISGFPQRQRRTLNFIGSAQTALATTSYAETTYNLNGLFAPATGSGTQPVGYARYMAIYSKAYVVSCKWRLNVANCNNVGGVPPPTAIVHGATVTTNTTTLGGTFQAIGSGLCQYACTGANPDSRQFQGTVNIAKFLGRKVVVDNQDMYSTTAANPSQVVCLHVWGYNPGGTAANMAVFLTLEFDVIFTDPIPFT